MFRIPRTGHVRAHVRSETPDVHQPPQLCNHCIPETTKWPMLPVEAMICQSLQHRCVNFTQQGITAEFEFQNDGFSKED
jgi:hypothetical protein